MALKKENFKISKEFIEDNLNSFETMTSKNSVQIKSTTEKIDGIVVEKITKTFLKTKNMSSNRLGLNVFRQTEVLKNQDIAPELSNNIKINSITFLNEKTNKINANFQYYSGIQGHNVKNLTQIYKKVIPSISVNRIYNQKAFYFGFIDSEYDDLTYGQETDIVIVSEITKKLLPFNDRLSQIYSPKNHVEIGEYILGYPIVTDNIVDFENYRNPDSIMGTIGGRAKNGIIEIFDVRSSMSNTYSSDIFIKGVKGTYGVSNNDAGNITSTKGASIVDYKYEINQSNHDFYEDCQDIVYNTGHESNKIILSQIGYVSTGNYTISPFEDKIINENHYQKFENISNIMLGSSNLNISEIGTRYKQTQNGFIMEPFISRIFTNHSGGDSIAYRGLLRG